MKTRNLYLQVWPLPKIQTWGTNRWKTKGGTLGIFFYFFQKSSQIWTRIGLKIPKQYFRNKNTFKKLVWPMQHCACSAHALLSRKPACTECAWGSHGGCKGPPFGFPAICPPRLYFWQGSNLKIEISSFHFSSSFCENKVVCYCVSSILKIPPPPCLQKKSTRCKKDEIFMV